VKAKRYSHFGFVADVRHIMLEKFGLLAQRLGIASSACRETAIRALRGIGGSLLSLPIVERVCKVYPETSIVPQYTPDLIEYVKQVAYEIIRMVLVPEFSFPAIWPSGRGTIATEKIERR